MSVATSSTTSEFSAVCGPLQEVVQLSADASLLWNEALLEILTLVEQRATLDQAAEAQLIQGFREALTEVTPLFAQVVESYESALAVAPKELRDDLVALRVATVVLWPIMVEAAESASTVDEFSVALEQAASDPSFQRAALAGGPAALRLDQFTIPECGFKLSN